MVEGTGIDLAEYKASLLSRFANPALLVTGFSYDAATRRDQGRVLQRVVGEARDVRCFGFPALHLCWVACGRLDGYWETDLKPWDVAAGGLMAEEAGARVLTPATTGGTWTLGPRRTSSTTFAPWSIRWVRRGRRDRGLVAGVPSTTCCWPSRTGLKRRVQVCARCHSMW